MDQTIMVFGIGISLTIAALMFVLIGLTSLVANHMHKMGETLVEIKDALVVFVNHVTK